MRNRYKNEVHEGFYSRLFLEDFYNGIVYSCVSRGFEKGISFSTNEKTLERRLNRLFIGNYFPVDGRPTYCMQKFLEIKVRELLLYGECVVEIKLAKKTKRIKIKMPKELISPLSHKKMLYRISKIRSDLPEYTKREKLKDSIAEGFDIRKYDLDRKKAIMAITTRWGGIPRVDIMSMTTSYQYIVGYLRTKYVELIISEHLVKELNVILKKNNFRNRIRLDAKYSSREILDAIEKLYSGKVNMSYALDFR